MTDKYGRTLDVGMRVAVHGRYGGSVYLGRIVKISDKMINVKYYHDLNNPKNFSTIHRYPSDLVMIEDIPKIPV